MRTPLAICSPKWPATRLRRPAPPRLRQEVFAFPAGDLCGPKVHVEDRLLMSAVKPFADINRVSRQVRRGTQADIS